MATDIDDRYFIIQILTRQMTCLDVLFKLF